jgi:UDPglucose 6-dehydrogenase
MGLGNESEIGRLIGFAGLSHLGIVSSISAASKGFGVLGYDPDADLCARLNEGEFAIYEPGLEELFLSSHSSIKFTNEVVSLGGCKLVYLSLDVSTDENGRSDLTDLHALAEDVIHSVADGTILVILSQVAPGFTRQLAGQHRSLFKEKDIQLFYQVETLIFGNAVERALFPERYIVGCRDHRTALPSCYASLLDAFECPVLPMRYESAELAKISINLCLASSISITNTLAELCEESGADWYEIAPALRLDKRIGQHAYLNPGLGIGGGNIERDLVAVCQMGKEKGTDIEVVEAFRHNSRYRRDWVLRKIREVITEHQSESVIGIWGLAYKANTTFTKNSPALSLIDSLSEFSLRVYDPAVCIAESSTLKYCQSPLEVVKGVDVLAIMTPWDEFSSVDLSDLKECMVGDVVIDPYRVFNAYDCEAHGISHLVLGK